MAKRATWPAPICTPGSIVARSPARSSLQDPPGEGDLGGLGSPNAGLITAHRLAATGQGASEHARPRPLLPIVAHRPGCMRSAGTVARLTSQIGNAYVAIASPSRRAIRPNQTGPRHTEETCRRLNSRLSLNSGVDVWITSSTISALRVRQPASDSNATRRQPSSRGLRVPRGPG